MEQWYDKSVIDDVTEFFIHYKPKKVKTMLDYPVLAFDFDGTISEENYPACGDPLKDVKEVMNYLYVRGFGIVIFSCREHEEHKQAAKNFLNENGIKFHYFNENWPALTEKYGISSRKLGADMYFDDKTLEFHLTTWKQKLEMIKVVFADYIKIVEERGLYCER